MTTTIDSGLFFHSAILIYIVTGLCCAAVRQGHVCLPYKEDPDYYFPNRLRWVVTYGLSIMLAGCVIFPHNEETIVAARCWLLLLTTNFMVTGVIKHCNKKSIFYKISYVTAVPIALAIGLCALSWLHTGYLLQYQNLILATTAIIGLLFTVAALQTLFWVRTKLSQYYENKYSNEDNFPVNYAKEIIPRLLLLIPAIWLTFISSNRLVLGSAYIIISLFHVASLVYILDNHTPLAMKQKDVAKEKPEPEMDEMEEAIEEEERTTTMKPNEKLLEDLKTLMENERPYLNPNLTIMELAKMLDTSVEVLRFNCKNSYGSFIKMVNGYRLAHSKRISQEHPKYSKQAIAEESGFGSYRSLLRAEKATESA